MAKSGQRRAYDLRAHSLAGAVRRRLALLIGLFVIALTTIAPAMMAPIRFADVGATGAGVRLTVPAEDDGALRSLAAILGEPVAICSIAGGIGDPGQGGGGGHDGHCAYCLPLMSGTVAVPEAVTLIEYMLRAEGLARPQFAVGTGTAQSTGVVARPRGPPAYSLA